VFDKQVNENSVGTLVKTGLSQFVVRKIKSSTVEMLLDCGHKVYGMHYEVVPRPNRKIACFECGGND